MAHSRYGRRTTWLEIAPQQVSGGNAVSTDAVSHGLVIRTKLMTDDRLAAADELGQSNLQLRVDTLVADQIFTDRWKMPRQMHCQWQATSTSMWISITDGGKPRRKGKLKAQLHGQRCKGREGKTGTSK